MHTILFHRTALKILEKQKYPENCFIIIITKILIMKLWLTFMIFFSRDTSYGQIILRTFFSADIRSTYFVVSSRNSHFFLLPILKIHSIIFEFTHFLFKPTSTIHICPVNCENWWLLGRCLTKITYIETDCQNKIFLMIVY